MEKIQKIQVVKNKDKPKQLPRVDVKRVLFYISGFLFGSIRLWNFAPFGIAYLSLGRKLSWRTFLMFALTLGGTFLIGDGYMTLKYAMAQGIYVTILYAVGGKEEELTINSAGFVAASSIFLSSMAIFVWFGNPTPIDFLIVIFETALVFAASYAFNRGINRTAPETSLTPDVAIEFVDKRLSDVSGMFQNLATIYGKIFERRNPDKITNEEDVSELFDTTAERVCRKCKKAMLCWGQEFDSTTDVCFKLLEVMEKRGEVTLPDVPMHFRERCIRLPTFINELNSLFDIYRINSIWKNKMAENYELVGEMNRGVSYMLNDLIKELKTRPRLRNPEIAEEQLVFEVSSASLGISKTEQNGDEYCFVNLGCGKYAVILSDGMGHGNTAAVDSSVIIEILRNVLQNGFDKTIAVKMLNSVMGLRAKESYSTADICFLDAVSGEVEFIKIGAAPAYIKRKNKVETVSANTLPVGVLANFEVETFTRTLNVGDYIIMTSDGIENPFDGQTKKLISEISFETPPQEFAETMIAASCGAGEQRDDMMCVVIRVGELEEMEIKDAG